ncbi:hypothetical protein K474DRAFT_408476 [Panus rudis PR-1116 ss-1]|nr:hypothetical protein K474DRAFT_408476 [Panus rudis PR-1116 ss-1]
MARDMSQGSSNLRKGIQDFIEDVETILDGYDISGAERRIKELDSEIKDLLSDLNEIRIKVGELSRQLDVAIAATSASGIFGFLCPVWWIGTAISVAQIPALKAQLSAVKAQQDQTIQQINIKESERARLQADIQTISRLRTTLDECAPDMETIETKLGALSTVWAAIRADSQALLEKLEHAGDTESETLFALRVKTVQEMYQKLLTALETYRDLVGIKSSMVHAIASLKSTSAVTISD